MAEQLKLMCVLAHPDDESAGTGGVLARYGAEAVATSIVMATRGERGWRGEEQDNPGLAALGAIREAELRQAARVLGVADLEFLDYIDGDLDQADPAEAIAKIVQHLRRQRPHVVVTFDPNGAYGHPDHIAISQLATAAIVAAADANYGDVTELPPHRVSKLYFRVWSERLVTAMQKIAGDQFIEIDGKPRGMVGWHEWAITTRIDLAGLWERVRAAIDCHESQRSNFEGFDQLPAELLAEFRASETYYRAFSLVNGGRAVEDDLFAGLR
jgi:LmbE family N-acetylglucosaminyl deacetylase